MIPQCVILGGGGHARVLIESLRLGQAAQPVAILDAAPERAGQDLDGVEIVGGDEMLPILKGRGVTYFAVGLGSVGNCAPRRRLFEFAMAQGLQPVTVVHPAAIVSPAACLGAGVQVLARAVINPGAVLEENVIINTGAIVEHDCLVGAHAHVASGACLCGAVRVLAGAHVGAGSVTRQGCTIGEDAVVGAGAVVVKDVPARNVYAGVPATRLRPC